MNWIKQNTFFFSLIAIAVVGAIVLWMLGSGAAGRYADAKLEYDNAVAEITTFERQEPYPTPANLESKKLELEKYQTETNELQKAFAPYRPEDLDNISVQDFSNAVKQANRKTRAAFGKDTEVPDNYYCGFELYRSALPPGNATGILNYQLQAVEKMMLNLAESGISSLVSVHRPKLPEEDGKAFEPADGQIARELPVEIVFQGRESAVRQFLSSIANDKENFLVVRSLRIANEKLAPPRTSDAKFGTRRRAQPAEAKGEGQVPNFDELFNPDGAAAPGEAPKPDIEGPAAPAPAPEILPSDTSRILSQVLGNEEIQVFVRVDALLFLEPKELP